MNYILIKDIYDSPTLVKDSEGKYRGDDYFIKCLFQQYNKHIVTMPIRHGSTIGYYNNHYIILDLKKIISPNDWNIIEADPIDILFLNEEKIGEILKVEFRDKIIEELL